MIGFPQDARSPIQQSRWIHAQNTGSETIPAYGVCEVFANTVDEASGVETLKIQRPTAHGLPECVVNSFAPIEPGEYGWVTRDFPAHASGSGLVVGDMVGTQKNSFDLVKGYPGFMVVGNGPTGTFRVVDMWEPLVRGTLGATLSCTTAKATISSAWVSRVSLSIADARNTYKLSGANNTQVALQWDGKGLDSADEAKGCWVVLQTEQSCSSSSSSTVISSSTVSSSSLSTSSLSSSGSSSSTSLISSSSSSASLSSSSASGSSASSTSSSGSCSGQCTDISIVTDVSCVNGSIVVTKKTLRICGANLCIEVL